MLYLKTQVPSSLEVCEYVDSHLLGAAVMGRPLSRLRQRLGDATVLGGQEREGQELNASPELGLPVWVLPNLAPSGFV